MSVVTSDNNCCKSVHGTVFLTKSLFTAQLIHNIEKSANIPNLVDGGYCFEPQCWDGWLDLAPIGDHRSIPLNSAI